MSRILNAWRALMGAEPEVREVEVVREVPVIGAASLVKLYEAKARRYADKYEPWQGNLYQSCEQAHRECPGAEVSVVNAVLVAGSYFRTYEFLTKVQPKPKRAKGAK